MWLPSTNEVIETFKEFYNKNYKAVLNTYKAELEFATILSYYSGSFAFVIDIHSTPDSTARTDMCIMLECDENDFTDLKEENLHNFFRYKILEKYKELLELNMILCNKNINRKVIITHNNFNEAIFNIRVERETLRIELNYKKIEELNNSDKDFLNVVDGICQLLKQ
jgi:hypothetical protein